MRGAYNCNQGLRSTYINEDINIYNLPPSTYFWHFLIFTLTSLLWCLMGESILVNNRSVGDVQHINGQLIISSNHCIPSFCVTWSLSMPYSSPKPKACMKIDTKIQTCSVDVLYLWIQVSSYAVWCISRLPCVHRRGLVRWLRSYGNIARV